MSRRTLFALVAVLLGVCASATASAEEILVFAAASLTDVLDDLSRAFTAQTHVGVKSSFAASSVLAKQIEAGAPADVFFSADPEWMDYLGRQQLLKPRSRHDVVANRLVLIAPADSQMRVTLRKGVDLKALLGAQGKLATGDPDAVPVGKYAKAALQNLGAWEEVESSIVGAENTRAALAFVARGEAPLGIVYETDAMAEKRVRIVGEFPQDSHPPIRYPIATTTHGGAASQQFVDFVRSPPAAKIFRKYGFSPLE